MFSNSRKNTNKSKGSRGRDKEGDKKKGNRTGSSNVRRTDQNQRRPSLNAPPGFSNGTQSSTNDLAERINRERMLFLAERLIGLNVEIQNVKGITYTGVLCAAKMSTTQEFSIILKTVQIKNGKPDDDFQPGNNMVISSKDIVQLYTSSISLERNAENEGIMTDMEISGSSHADLYGRELKFAESWLGSSNEIGHLEDSSDSKSWNQFEANKKLFGVQSTYDESIYTTKLDKRQLTAQQAKEAERLAREIERQSTSNFHLAEERGQTTKDDDYDEEARYSSVFRSTSDSTNAARQTYIPPALRKSELKQGEQTTVKSSIPSSPKHSQTITKSSNDSTSIAKDDEIKSVQNGSSTKTDNLNEEVPKDASTDEKEKISEDAAKSKVEKKTKKGLNPNAKEFKLNASAASFTPSFAQSQYHQNAGVGYQHNVYGYQYDQVVDDGYRHYGVPMGQYAPPGAMMNQQMGYQVVMQSGPSPPHSQGYPPHNYSGSGPMSTLPNHQSQQYGYPQSQYGSHPQITGSGSGFSNVNHSQGNILSPGSNTTQNMQYPPQGMMSSQVPPVQPPLPREPSPQ